MGSMRLFLLMYESHDMRRIGFSQVDGGQRDPPRMERHTCPCGWIDRQLN